MRKWATVFLGSIAAAVSLVVLAAVMLVAAAAALVLVPLLALRGAICPPPATEPIGSGRTLGQLLGLIPRADPPPPEMVDTVEH